MNKRTKALDIPRMVKEAVARRDSFDGWTCCILCGQPAPPDHPTEFSCAHFIPRSHGGLGVEKNILTLCPKCHQRYDNSSERERLREEFKEYLNSCYPDWDEQKLIYRKE